jgi:hypothetical protein
MGPYLEDIRIPTGIHTLLRQINEEIGKQGFVQKEGRLFLPPLTKKQKMAFTFFVLSGEVGEVIENLNMILTDLDYLCENPRLFALDRSPLKRYKLLFRSFFYEFSRFEDIFGYFMMWLERLKIISREDRKALRNDFYEMVKPMVKIRNTMLHESFSVTMEGIFPEEIYALEAAEGIGRMLIQADGTVIDWKTIMSPVFVEHRDILFQEGSAVRDYCCGLFDLRDDYISRPSPYNPRQTPQPAPQSTPTARTGQ